MVEKTYYFSSFFLVPLKFCWFCENIGFVSVGSVFFLGGMSSVGSVGGMGFVGSVGSEGSVGFVGFVSAVGSVKYRDSLGSLGFVVGMGIRGNVLHDLVFTILTRLAVFGPFLGKSEM